MADVKKCDRCNAIFNDGAEETYKIHKTYYNGHEAYDDLCPHCSNMYKEFMWGRRLKDEVWDNGKVY